MQPILKFDSIVISLSTLIMFSIWTLIQTLNIQDNIFEILAILISFVTSIGCYRLLVSIFYILFDRIHWFRVIILGPFCLEGTWVGFSAGSQGDIRFYYEKFDQELDSVNIYGQSFTENGGFHGSWYVRNPMIDIESGEMTYCFEADSIKNTWSNPGFGRFKMIRETKNDAPFMLRGYTSYVYNTTKLFGLEVKIKDGNYSDQELYSKAQAVYEKYKYVLKE